MPRKPKKKSDTLASLELLSRDMSMPEEVRREAAKEYVRLTTKDAPAPHPSIPKLSYAEAYGDAPIVSDDVFVAFKPPAPEKSESKPTGPKVTDTELSESQEFQRASPERARAAAVAKAEQERLARVRQSERPETVEECKARLWKQKSESSAAWYRQMGNRPDDV